MGCKCCLDLIPGLETPDAVEQPEKEKKRKEKKIKELVLARTKAFFFFFVFLPFLGLLPWHLEVLRLGVESEL